MQAIDRPGFFDELQRYVGFEPADSELLAAHRPPAAVLEEVVERFYLKTLEHEGTRRHVEDPATVARLQATLIDWLETLFAGPHDEAYVRKRSRIGRRHVQIGLEQQYIFAAMALVREDLGAAIERALVDDADRRHRTVRALHKILDLELAIMVETYREEKVEIETLRESEIRCRDLLDHAPEMILTVDRAGAIHHINRTALSALGWTDGSPATIRDLFAPERHDEAWRRLAERFDGATGNSLEFESEFRSNDDRRIRVEIRFAGVRQADGGPEIVRLFALDVTDKRRLESRMAEYQRQVEEKRRLAAIGQMVAGIAHEIRTPLQVITTGVDALSRAVDDRDLERETARTREGLRQIREFIQEILDYSKEVTLDRMAVDPATLIASVEADLAEDLARTSIRLERRFEPEVGRLDGDPFRLKQVFLNLVKNAIEAAPEGSSIHVAVAEIDNMIAIDVRDEGRGISPEDRERIFVPFFTTKPRGTGLGLAIVRRIIDAHGGRIAVGDATGAGTSIRVLIPCAPSQPVDAR